MRRVAVCMFAMCLPSVGRHNQFVRRIVRIVILLGRHNSHIFRQNVPTRKRPQKRLFDENVPNEDNQNNCIQCDFSWCRSTFFHLSTAKCAIFRIPFCDWTLIALVMSDSIIAMCVSLSLQIKTLSVCVFFFVWNSFCFFFSFKIRFVFFFSLLLPNGTYMKICNEMKKRSIMNKKHRIMQMFELKMIGPVVIRRKSDCC